MKHTFTTPRSIFILAAVLSAFGMVSCDDDGGSSSPTCTCDDGSSCPDGDQAKCSDLKCDVASKPQADCICDEEAGGWICPNINDCGTMPEGNTNCTCEDGQWKNCVDTKKCDEASKPQADCICNDTNGKWYCSAKEECKCSDGPDCLNNDAANCGSTEPCKCSDGTDCPNNDAANCGSTEPCKCSDGTDCPNNDIANCGSSEPCKSCDGTDCPNNDAANCGSTEPCKCSDGTDCPNNDAANCESTKCQESTKTDADCICNEKNGGWYCLPNDECKCTDGSDCPDGTKESCIAPCFCDDDHTVACPDNDKDKCVTNIKLDAPDIIYYYDTHDVTLPDDVINTLQDWEWNCEVEPSSIDGNKICNNLKVINESTDKTTRKTLTITNSTPNARNVTLTAKSKNNPLVAASTTIVLKPYIEFNPEKKEVCIVPDIIKNDKEEEIIVKGGVPNAVCRKKEQAKFSIDTSKNNDWPRLTDGTYDEETTQIFNNDLYEEVAKYLQKTDSGEYGTRASVVAAARFIALQFPFFIPYRDNWVSLTDYPTDSHYVWSGKRWENYTPKKGYEVRIYGFNLTSKAYNYNDYHDINNPASSIIQTSVSPWGADIVPILYQNSNGNGTKNGLSCTGFVTWALRNGRFYIGDWWTYIFGNYGDCKDKDGNYLRHFKCIEYVNGVTNKISGSYKGEPKEHPATRAVNTAYTSKDDTYQKLSQLNSTSKTPIVVSSILSSIDSTPDSYKKLRSKDCQKKIVSDKKVPENDVDCGSSYDCTASIENEDTLGDVLNGESDFINFNYLNNIEIQKNIKTGDLLWYGRNRCTGQGGHIGMIIGIDRNSDDSIKWLYIAESTSAPEYIGIVVTRNSVDYVRDSKWKDVGRDRFIIRMDNVYDYFYNDPYGKNYNLRSKYEIGGNMYRYDEIESFVKQ